jgi:hypothetical protein
VDVRNTGQLGYITTRITAENLAEVFTSAGVVSLRTIANNGSTSMRFYAATYNAFGPFGLPANFATEQVRQVDRTVRVVVREVGGQERRIAIIFTVNGGKITSISA